MKADTGEPEQESSSPLCVSEVPGKVLWEAGAWQRDDGEGPQPATRIITAFNQEPNQGGLEASEGGGVTARRAALCVQGLWVNPMVLPVTQASCSGVSSANSLSL